MASTASSSSTDFQHRQQDTTEHKDYATQHPGAQARPQRTNPDYGGNPLAHILTAGYGDQRLPAFGGAFQPGLYKPPAFKFANPVPLGLAGFALTTFLLSLINLGTCGITEPNLVIAPALAYGGLVQLLAGMWDIALGNTFGGTALSSYGGFWIGTAILLTPGGFDIAGQYSTTGDFYAAFAFYLIGWFIFTFMLWLCTLKSTVAFSSLLFFVWLTFLFLFIAYLGAQTNGTGMPTVGWVRAGGATGIIAAFIAWYNMLAGLCDKSNSFIVIPVVHFPWSEKGREDRAANREAVSGDGV
ncbi:Accumulation of DYads [Recurvomyces mirabilis]|uniref:Accumulation of DYads n=1 Tax=Recurvomyces mirabilis TaxID=574656 RepID=A0AAE0WVH4_9PEZI|nr:Accumulation of DYads [Recurvomyces mirabilis]KAK5161260.1 Accumulation of DYads [Recurvomyces mirabilis]